MRVVVQVSNVFTGRQQHGEIDEPVGNGLDVQNALAHFGVDQNYDVIFSTNNPITMVCGHVPDSDIYFTVIAYEIQENGRKAKTKTELVGQTSGAR